MSDVAEDEDVDSVSTATSDCLVSFKLVPQEMSVPSRLRSWRDRWHSGGHSDTLSMPSRVCCGFLGGARSAPAGNYGLERDPLFPLLGLIVQELKMSFISGIKRSLSTNELWMDMNN